MIAISKTCLKSLQNKNIWILTRKTITFNFRIIDGHIGFPYCRLFFDKSNERSIKLETAVTWSKSNLNMMNIYEESTINFWIWPVTGTGHRLVTRYRYRSRICHRLQVPITDLSPVTGADHWFVTCYRNWSLICHLLQVPITDRHLLKVPITDSSSVTGADPLLVICYRYQSLICHLLQEPIIYWSFVTDTSQWLVTRHWFGTCYRRWSFIGHLLQVPVIDLSS